MTKRQIAAAACHLEGGKSQIKMGDMMQAIECLAQVEAKQKRETPDDNWTPSRLIRRRAQELCAGKTKGGRK